MGWTSYHATHYKKGEIDRKAECDALFNTDMVSWDNNNVIGKFEVLKSCIVGSTYYAAIKRTKFATETEPEDSIVFAAVVLTSINNKDYYNFSYKDMDETVGPYQYNCPKTILDLLSPTDNKYANEWRAKCHDVLKKKKSPDKLNNLPVGSVIKYTRPNGEEMMLFKHPAGYQFKRPFWMLKDKTGYVSPKHIPDNYEIIKRGV